MSHITTRNSVFKAFYYHLITVYLRVEGQSLTESKNISPTMLKLPKKIMLDHVYICVFMYVYII